MILITDLPLNQIILITDLPLNQMILITDLQVQTVFATLNCHRCCRTDHLQKQKCKYFSCFEQNMLMLQMLNVKIIKIFKNKNFKMSYELLSADLVHGVNRGDNCLSNEVCSLSP